MTLALQELLLKKSAAIDLVWTIIYIERERGGESERDSFICVICVYVRPGNCAWLLSGLDKMTLDQFTTSQNYK